MARRLAAIMFTDIVDYTSAAQTDEAGALKMVQEQEELVRPLLGAHGGRKVKSMGDGLLIEFHNVLDAVECAVELQRRTHELDTGDHARALRLRVGIHLGDVQRRGTDILGDAVNIASRIEPLAEPGGVCLSEPVYVQIRNKVPYQFENLGSRSLKGVQEPMEVYRVVLPWARGEPASGRPEPARLAVLPFTNISPDPKDEYFADGLTEELISVISQIGGLRVISRTSVSRYKATTKSIAQIGAELGVSSLLEGSVRKTGDQLRITVQLIDVGTDEHRWAHTYDLRLENVFAIQAEVAERTASALKVELLKSEREAIQERPTSSLAAHESYLRGIQASRRITEGLVTDSTDKEYEKNDQEVVKCLEDAIREDPGFSAAYSYLANYLLGAMSVTRSAADVLPRVRQLVAKALELSPNSSDAHTARGNLAFQGDLEWTRAEAEFQQAIVLNPSNSAAHFWYGFLLQALQRFDEVRKQLRAAIELDPLWLQPRINLLWTQVSSGELESAITFGKKLRESFGDDLSIRHVLAWAYVRAGRGEDALRLMEPLAGASDLPSRATRSWVLALLGRSEEARALLAEWEGGRVHGPFFIQQAAQYYALWGEREKALTFLEQDYREGERSLWSRYQSEFFDPIRDDPRFVALLRAMNLPTTLGRPIRAPGSHGPA